MEGTEYRRAPKGFTNEQWDTFMEKGILVIENALSDAEVDRYGEMIDRAVADDPKYDSTKHFGPNNIVERYPEFAELILCQPRGLW